MNASFRNKDIKTLIELDIIILKLPCQAYRDLVLHSLLQVVRHKSGEITWILSVRGRSVW